MLLVNVGKLHRFTDVERTGISLLQTHNQPEERGLTGTIGTNHPDNTIWRQDKVKVLEEFFLRIRLRYMLCHDDLVAQTRTVGNEYLQFLLLLFLFLVKHRLV